MLDMHNETTTATSHDEAATAAPSRPRRLMGSISGPEAMAIVAFWLVSTSMLTAMAPAPDPVQPPLIIALNVIFNVGFITALGGAILRRGFTLAGSMAAGAAMAIAATMCGLDGHTGLWIPAQFVFGAGILAYGAHRLRS
jgi:hypothetical protein